VKGVGGGVCLRENSVLKGADSSTVSENYRSGSVLDNYYDDSSAPDPEPPASDPSKPIILSVNANPGNDSVSLTSSLNPNGDETVYYIEYGTTNDYGSKTFDKQIGAGFSVMSIEESITGLQSEVFYHYRIVAENSHGKVFSADHSFLTGRMDRQPEVITGETTETASSVLMKGRVNPNGSKTYAFFQYGETQDALWSTVKKDIGSAEGLIELVEEIQYLDPNTFYYYRIVAENEGGTSSGEIKMFLSPSVSLVPNIIGPSVDSITSSSAVLRSNIDPRGQSIKYHFEYGASLKYGFVTTERINNMGSENILATESIAGLIADSKYYFKIVVVYNGETAIKTGAFRTPLSLSLPDIKEVSAEYPTFHSVILKTEVNPMGSAVEVYFEYGTATDYLHSSDPLYIQYGMTPISFEKQISNLQQNTVYHCRAVAVGVNGTVYSEDMMFSTLPAPYPPTIENMDVNIIGGDVAELNGRINPKGFATTYYFEYGIDDGQALFTEENNLLPGTTMLNVKSEDQGLISGVSYFYRLVAENENGRTVGEDSSFQMEIETVLPGSITGSAEVDDAGGITFDGVVNPSGLVTNYYFEYGATLDYGSKTNEMEAGDGYDDVLVKVTIEDEENIVSHYRIVAINSNGFAYGEDALIESRNPKDLATGNENARSGSGSGVCFISSLF